LYLRAINEGATTAEANRAAQIDIANGSTEIIREAQQCVRSVYGGKQLPMIAEAKKLGWLLAGYNGVLASARTQTPMSQPHSTTTATRGDLAHTDFDAYHAIFLAEVKRLSGKASSDLHWVELTDDTGIRNAFSDGVDPKALAFAFHKRAKPPLQ
jgi:hypothetical protein